MDTQYNVRNPAVKRLMREAQELRDRTELYYAQPLEDNLFEWHFTVRGPPDTDFSGGIYHGRIILPPEYPMKPPSIMMMTPNGRFELHKKICLSISGYHPESWQPSWSIRTALLAIIGFMPTHGAGAIGSLEYSPDERKTLARKSQDWKCQSCDVVLRDALLPVTDASKQTADEAKELAQQISFKGESERSASSASLQSLDRSDTANTDTSSSPPAVAESPAPELRQRQVPSSPPVVAPAAQMNEQQTAGSGSLLMILIVSFMIAALLMRRIYVMNEWRFHTEQE